MPFTLPPFKPYQAPFVPLPDSWNIGTPPEGPRLINCEIDWSQYVNPLATPSPVAVQLNIGNSATTPMSRIASLSVDNSGSGSDVQFYFPDTGFQLVVPATEGGTFNVFTNGVLFYAVTKAALITDKTVFQIHNTLPPPQSIAPASETTLVSATGIPVNVSGTTQILQGSGTIKTLQVITELFGGGATETAVLQLIDINGTVLWQTGIAVAANAVTMNDFTLPNLNVRFNDEIVLVIGSSTIAGGLVNLNIYYGT